MKKPRPRPYLVLALALAACNAPLLPAASAEEVETACQRAIVSLREDKGHGLSCEAAKLRASQKEPLCNLTFTCPTPKDAGVE